MKAIISDVHANIEAFTAVVKDISDKGVTEVVNLGDIVGYGPNPVECLDLAQKFNIKIMGNHEEAILKDPKNFNPRALRAFRWTKQQLFEVGAPKEVLEERHRIIESFSHRMEDERGFTYVHGSPRAPTREYLTPRFALDRIAMRDVFNCFDKVCFVGHSHLPGVFTLAQGFLPPSEIFNLYMIGDEKVIINVGSVGQPRDGNPQAGYVTLDEDSVVFRRVEYNPGKTAAKIYAIDGLDDFQGDRLLEGR